jgi:hypothetical protein
MEVNMRILKIISAALLATTCLSGPVLAADSWIGTGAYGTGTTSTGADGHFAAGRSAVGVWLGRNQTLTSYNYNNSATGSVSYVTNNGDGNSINGNSLSSLNTDSDVTNHGSISK